MKILLVDMYKLIFRITNNSTLSIAISLIYITILNLTVAYGLTTLWPSFRALGILFRFPFIVVPGVVFLLLARRVMMPFKNIHKEKRKPIGYLGLIMYTVLAIIIYVYTRYGNLLFQ